VQQQTSEDGIQALNLVIVSDVASESTPARDSSLPVSTPSPFMTIAQEPEATNIECTQVPITEADPKPKVGDQVDFCSSLNPSKPKAKSMPKRKANKESCVAGGKATFSEKKAEKKSKLGTQNESKASN